MNEIQIMMACNNPDNGNFTGRVDAIDITATGCDIAMALRATRGPLRVGWLDSNRRKIGLGHLKIRALGYGSWVGNWCWDSATVTPKTAAKVINYLNRRGWEDEGGYVALGEKYDVGEVTADDLVSAMFED